MTSHQPLMGYPGCLGLLIVRQFYFPLVENAGFVSASFEGFFNSTENILFCIGVFRTGSLFSHRVRDERRV
jgi:hypothetical protein